MRYPADPESDEVDGSPCWVDIPKESMIRIWNEMGENERLRVMHLERLQRVKSSSWLAICRSQACVNIDLEVWFPLIRALALEAPMAALKREVPIRAPEHGDAEKLAQEILYKAVSGQLDISDNERVKAALALMKMPNSKVGDTIINVSTGVPREG